MFNVTFSKKKKKKKKWAARLGFSFFFLTSTDCLARIMLQQFRFCIYKGKINVKLPNAFKCFLCNVLYIFSVHFLLNLGADAKNYLSPRFMSESSQIKPIKTPNHLNRGQLRVVSKVTSFLLFLTLRVMESSSILT